MESRVLVLFSLIFMFTTAKDIQAKRTKGKTPHASIEHSFPAFFNRIPAISQHVINSRRMTIFRKVLLSVNEKASVNSLAKPLHIQFH